MATSAPPATADGASCYVIDCGTGQSRVLRLTRQSGLVSLVDLGELPVLKETVELGKLEEWGQRLKELIVPDHRQQQQQQSEDTVATQLNLACSAWYRKLSDELRHRYDAAFNVAAAVATQTGMGFSTLLLRDDEEARYELAAVRYAATRVLRYSPDVVVSGGKGSSQISFGGKVCSLDLPLSDGARLVTDAAGKEQWSKQVADAMAAAGVADWPPLSRPDAKVIAISGFFYGAKAAGLPTGADIEPATCAAAISALSAKAADGSGPAQDVANWIRMGCVLSGLPLSDVQRSTVVFAREWKVDGVPFRTTWSAGMFVEDQQRML
eukprot:TRINITY_DN3731_c0_g2_i1.p1 TRINITY_DN3731_c0_g2~~TRINITY_DN3731_c0_g2_i1.p1  ORF type:complete len:324 (+),score=69.65 TRINITY_DN3731_c0_g2_i1:130-1101(+)